MDGKDVVNKYYEYYNASNIDGVMSLMAEDCKYHDMIYSDPFEGHEEIRAYFEKVVSSFHSLVQTAGNLTLLLSPPI